MVQLAAEARARAAEAAEATRHAAGAAPGAQGSARAVRAEMNASITAHASAHHGAPLSLFLSPQVRAEMNASITAIGAALARCAEAAELEPRLACQRLLTPYLIKLLPSAGIDALVRARSSMASGCLRWPLCASDCLRAPLVISDLPPSSA